MTYNFLEHQADMGIVGIGKTLEESFQEGAKAMFDAMYNIKQIEQEKSITIKIKADNRENLFVKFLNELITQADINEMAFSSFKVRIKNGTELECKARGQKINLKKHDIKTEVKAATYSGLRIYKKNSQFYSQCILDV